MQKKMIFFDIDGTLVNDTKEVLPSTKLALQELRKNGHEVAIATGRNLTMSRIVIDELEFDNYVLCNGAVGYFHNEMVYENSLDKVEFDRLLKVADENQHPIIYETPELLRRRDKEASIDMLTAMKHVGFGVPEYDRDFYQHHKLVQSLIFYREKNKAFYESGQFPKFRFVRWDETGVDVLPKDGSKANTILKVAADQGFGAEDVLAFGDGLNDLEMIEKVGTGIAMGNALEEVKARAKKVTKSCNEDGIFLALKELNLI